MPFETLLLSSCLLPGRTDFKESNASVEVTPLPGETILFFNIDDKSNPDCKLRQFLWGMKKGEQMCDLIVFYAKERERVICFVELKHNIGHLGHATKQVINTYNNLKVHLQKSYTSYTPKAFISACGGSSPREHEEYQRELLKAFGKNNFDIKNRSNDALGDLLRGIPPKTGQGKRKNKK